MISLSVEDGADHPRTCGTVAAMEVGTMQMFVSQHLGTAGEPGRDMPKTNMLQPHAAAMWLSLALETDSEPMSFVWNAAIATG